MRYFYRKTLTVNPFEFDSVQGLLEAARWCDFSAGVIQLFVDEDSRERPDSLYSEILRLEKDGYLEVEWEPREHDSGKLQLRSMTLTTPGHELLARIQEKSAVGRLKRRVADLIWIVVTAIFVSVVTTLVTMQIKGCAS